MKQKRHQPPSNSTPTTARLQAETVTDAARRSVVLVADDDALIVTFLKLLLEGEGYQVIPAYDGEEAWTLARQAHPDVVVTDVMMPHLNGFQLLERLQAADDLCATRVILMSAVTQTHEPAGIPFIEKPFEIDEILGVIAGQLPGGNHA